MITLTLPNKRQVTLPGQWYTVKGRPGWVTDRCAVVQATATPTPHEELSAEFIWREAEHMGRQTVSYHNPEHVLFSSRWGYLRLSTKYAPLLWEDYSCLVDAGVELYRVRGVFLFAGRQEGELCAMVTEV